MTPGVVGPLGSVGPMPSPSLPEGSVSVGSVGAGVGVTGGVGANWLTTFSKCGFAAVEPSLIVKHLGAIATYAEGVTVSSSVYSPSGKPWMTIKPFSSVWTSARPFADKV